MSDKTARTHTHVSNRAKNRATVERKPVFKSVLDNPFHVRWPSIPVNLQNLCLARLVSILDGVSETIEKKLSSRKKGLEEKGHELAVSLDSGIDPGHTAFPPSGGEGPVTPSTVPITAPDGKKCPTILQHLSIGINEVTRKLEAQVQASRNFITLSSSDTALPPQVVPSHIAWVFICRTDIDPPILIDHIPHLVAACNAALLHASAKRNFSPIRLVTLPKGSELSLATALGLRRAAALAVDCHAPGLAILEDVIPSVDIVSAPWLVPHGTHRQLIPTHIKQTRTSAPKDMKAAKEHRAIARTAAKAEAKKRRQASALQDKQKKVVLSTPVDIVADAEGD
ncbi:hypothetical protein SERLA73DRAFT_189981 [Serpula lacrymans var. lacrymans S7.3]|uniref:Uncharacterized protein n=1 Tax=Serpula lacrymans var. lacrymans (strain S7.3) TaxID=936435 RepID=F8QEW3_SERL3|nr:hypothetical protein SERLA73DRAFT_189981 [Serpula lacrymans var. lacrymans S7.3]